jgi:hypothetical protein
MSSAIKTLSYNFFSHLKENYFTHFSTSFSLSFKMFRGSLALFVHAFFPNVFEYTGSNILKECIRDLD